MRQSWEESGWALTNSEVRELLSVLAAAEKDVVLDRFGAAAVETNTARAYKALRDAGTCVLRRHEPELLRMIDSGSPAAIIYAALLLRTYDAYDPQVLLERYAHDERACTIRPGGCGGVPGSQLKDAVDYVYGRAWLAPPERIRTRLERIHEALWFEFSTVTELSHARSVDRHGSSVDTSAWTFAFAELLVGPECAWALASERLAIEALRSDESSHVRLYAAALLRAIDPPAGLALFQQLQSDRSLVPLRPRFGLLPRSTPIAKLAGEVLDWLAWAIPELGHSSMARSR